MNIEYYDQNAKDLFWQYESTNFTAVHIDWLHLLPKTGKILDVGAGSGRDSIFLARQGLYVTAIEPAKNLRILASNNHPHKNITWLNDTLPKLTSTVALNKKFDLILLSAVWMHLSEPERKTAMPILCSLLNPDASIVITLRHGTSVDARTMHSVSYDEIKLLLDDSDFVCTLLTKSHHNADTLGREQVTWQTVQISEKENNE
jgi:2-polyprenyl-3-methyl-5-hydroxy-6-metoxy-1,4-benzoquinol methylase